MPTPESIALTLTKVYGVETRRSLKRSKWIATHGSLVASTMVTRVFVSLALSATLSAAFAQSLNPDRQFMHKAARGNISEVKLGRLAASQGGTADIRMFGQHMVTEHSTALLDLQRLAARKGVKLPAEPEPDAQRLYNRLRPLRGVAFDRLYKSEMIEDHEKDIREFATAARSARDRDVRRYAEKYLPHLREHLRRIQRTRV